MPPLPFIPPWSDQDIVLYHGTTDTEVTSILSGVDVSQCATLADFGPGFYTTTDMAQAQDHANKRVLRRGGVPAVIEFVVTRNDLAQLECLFFVRGEPIATDFWSFVKHGRMGGGDHRRAMRGNGWYDVVVGPVSGSWKKQTVIPGFDQISFHTQAGERLLDRSQSRQVV